MSKSLFTEHLYQLYLYLILIISKTVKYEISKMFLYAKNVVYLKIIKHNDIFSLVIWMLFRKALEAHFKSTKTLLCFNVFQDVLYF